MSKEVTYAPIPAGAYINMCMASIAHSGRRCHRAAEINQTTTITSDDEKKTTQVVVLQLCKHHANAEKLREQEERDKLTKAEEAKKIPAAKPLLQQAPVAKLPQK